MNSPVDPIELNLPDGLPVWLSVFVRDALAETTVLRQNGAEGAVAARMAVLRKLVNAADAWLNEELDTAAAAREQGCVEETIRDRAVERQRAVHGLVRYPSAASRCVIRGLGTPGIWKVSCCRNASRPRCGSQGPRSLAR